MKHQQSGGMLPSSSRKFLDFFRHLKMEYEASLVIVYVATYLKIVEGNIMTVHTCAIPEGGGCAISRTKLEINNYL